MQDSGQQALVIGFGAAARGFIAPSLLGMGVQTIFGLSSARWRWWTKQEPPPDYYRIESFSGDRQPAASCKYRPIAVVPCFGGRTLPSRQIVEAGARSRLIVTATGASELKSIVPVLAEILAKRAARNSEEDLNVIVADNISVSAEEISLLRDAVVEHGDDGELARYIFRHVGFVDSVLDARIVSRDASLDLLADDVRPALHINAVRVKGKLPVPTSPAGPMILEDAIRPVRMRRLFVHNLIDTALAYLGARRGYERIADAGADPKIRNVLDGALIEVCQALSREFPDRNEMTEANLAAYGSQVRKRIDNPILTDRIARPARDPMRKLHPGERFLGAARLARAHGISPVHLIECARAALEYWLTADVATCTRAGRIPGVENGFEPRLRR